MSPGNNDIVNGNVFKNSNYNSIDNVLDKYARERKVDAIADSLLEKFGLDNSSKGFMCKVARKLSEARIWSNYEAAQSASKSKVGLFIYLCKRDGV